MPDLPFPDANFTENSLPTVLICPGAPLEISRMLAACPALDAWCHPVWWAKSPRVAAQIRAELPESHIVPCQRTYRGTLSAQIWETPPFQHWCHQALRYPAGLAAREKKALGARDYAEAAAHVAEAVRILSLVRPAVVLVKAGTRLSEAAFCAVAQSLGIPLVYTERGAFSDSLFLDFRSVGPAMLRPLQSDAAQSDAGAEQIAAADSYLARYRENSQSAWEQPGLKGGAQLRRDLHLDPAKRVFFYASQAENDANMVLYSPHFNSNNAFLSFVLAALASVPDAVLVVKPHPKEKIAPRAQNKHSKSRLIVSRDINIKDILPLAQAVITLNSTIGFEALLHDKPVVNGASAYYSHRGWTFDIASSHAPGPLQNFLLDPQFSAAQKADFRRFSHQLMAQNLFFLHAEPGLNGPAEYLQKVISAAKPPNYWISPRLMVQAEEILAQSALSFESLSHAQLVREVWRRVRIKSKS